MPWRQKAKKDVVSCDKLRVAANRHKSGDFRIGQPIEGNTSISILEYIEDRSELGELKHLSTPRKRKKNRFP